MDWIFRTFLRLYPADYAALFGKEMVRTFRQTAEDYRRHGTVASFRFYLAEAAGLLCGAGLEWAAKLTTRKPVRNRILAERPDPDLPAEVLEAQQRVSILVNRLVQAIATHRFQDARNYSAEEQIAREHLRSVLLRHRIAE